MSNNANALTGCPNCGVINIDANYCQNCGRYITPEEVGQIYHAIFNGQPIHMYSSIKNSTLIANGSLDLQIMTTHVKIASGATCQKCKEFFPYAIDDEKFFCWACKNIWT